MHISEGVLAAPVLVAGGAVALAGTSLGLKRIEFDTIPQVAVLSASFFVASLIHVPLGPSSVHLLLNGLVGLLLGWAAFPAILVALLLQAVLFQFGGLTSLGVNTCVMAIPAVAAYAIFASPARSKTPWISFLASFLCGASAVFLGAILVALALVSTGEEFLSAAKLIVLAHLPVMAIEGMVTAICIRFLKKVKPEILGAVP